MQELLELTRELADKELRPAVDAAERAGTFPRETFRLLGRSGLLGLPYPERWGGGGQPYEVYLQVVEELARSWLTVGLGVSVHTLTCFPLATAGTPEQQERWLKPLLDGQIRSCFSMTEPEVASSDANNVATRVERDGDELVITGHKWWSSGAMSPRCKLSIVMGLSDPDGARHRRHSMVLVPMDSPGLTVLRPTTVFGYDDRPHGGHAEIVFDRVRVPVDNLLGEAHAGFALAQARLGPGRIHHCMRLIGMAERALELMCRRALGREAFGSPIADQGVVREWIAEARIRIEQARLLVLKAAWLMDTVGNKGAAFEIAAIKVVAPQVACWVIDRAIQVYGAAGVSQDTPLASLYSHARTLQIADGPDEVHRRSVARQELARWK